MVPNVRNRVPGHGVYRSMRKFRWLVIFLDFVRLELLSSAFPLGLLALVIASSSLSIPGIHRYDWLLVGGLVLQLALLALKLESWLDALVMLGYHLLGLALEILKVRAGSWTYPEPALTKIAGVPLFSGFMYASVASYMSIAWRKMNLEIVRWPGKWVSLGLFVGVYLQFFLPISWIGVQAAFAPRLVSAAIVAACFWRTRVYFDSGGARLWMPLNLSFVLIAFFIWVAENLCTRCGIWLYPHQQSTWEPVHIEKVLPWSLMVVVSVTILYTYKEAIKVRLRSVPSS